MQITKSQAKAMFIELGYPACVDWDSTRWDNRMTKLPEYVDQNTDEPVKDKVAADLIQKAVKALKDGKKIEIVADEKGTYTEPKKKSDAKATEAKKETAKTTDTAEPKKKAEKKDKEGTESTETTKKDKKKAEAAAEEPTEVKTEEETKEPEEPEIEERPECGWKLDGTEMVEDKELIKAAKKFANMDRLDIERPFKDKKVEFYKSLIANKEFRPPTWASAKCKEDGKTYRVNGQHSSAAVDGSDPEHLDSLVAYVEHYECETKADVARLWSTFDSKEQARSGGDINFSFAQTIDKVKNLDHRLINIAVGALTYAGAPSNMGGGKHHTSAERAEVLLKNKGFVVWLKNVIGERKDADTVHLWRTHVVAAMFKTYKAAGKDDAKDFWVAVREESDESNKAPTRKLAKWLKSLAMSGGRGSGTPSKERVVAKTVYGRCLEAWLKHQNGETGELKYENTEELPVVE